MKEAFLIAALAVPGLFFLWHPFSWKMTAVSVFILLAGILASEFGGSWKFDEWLQGLQETFHPPNPWVLVMSQERYPSKLATFHLPQHWETVPYPEHLREHFGMVLIDQSAAHWYEPIPRIRKDEPESQIPFTDEMLKYCFRALVKGGKVVVVERRKPIIVFEKNGH